MYYDIFACGVGGQGILAITDIISMSAVEIGLKVRGSETHGMSQRFGTVFATVRIGDIYSTLIAERSADVLIGMEPVETIRYAKYLKAGGHILMNIEPIPSPYSIVSKISYPELEKIMLALSKFTDKDKIIAINATKLALELGNSIVQNIILLGGLYAIPGFPLPKDSLIRAMKKQLKEKFHEINEKAFTLGQNQVKIYFEK
ncbi:indolepyruvate oxidoreductase subunit beta [Candidatus Hodarchaeum mangrovi]